MEVSTTFIFAHTAFLLCGAAFINFLALKEFTFKEFCFDKLSATQAAEAVRGGRVPGRVPLKL